jgi:NhaA family Na+:H+ antiporter
MLHPWVAYLIVPLFALANAGVALDGDFGAVVTEPVTLGVLLGLFVGKQVGITACTWLGVRSGLMSLPAGIGWRHIHGVACIAGIGFTMSLFIANLAFGEGQLLDDAKIGIFSASLLAGVLGYVLLRVQRPVAGEGAAAPSREAEPAVSA